MNVAQILKSIDSQLEQAQNGPVAASMQNLGLRYAHNRGVALTTLRQLAATLGHDADLARALWQVGHRETYILATLVAPPDALSNEHLQPWLDDCINTEMQEQMGMNLIVGLPQFTERIGQLAGQVGPAGQTCLVWGLAHAAFRRTDLHTEACLELLPWLAQLMQQDSSVHHRAVSVALRRLGRRNKQLSEAIIALAQSWLPLSDKWTQHAAREVVDELTDPDRVPPISN